MYKSLLVFLLLIGVIMIIIESVRTHTKCPREKIIYRYIPRSFEEEQEEPVYVSDIFKTMFTQASPWAADTNDVDTRKREVINNFGISQV
jgi:hypothetical protein